MAGSRVASCCAKARGGEGTQGGVLAVSDASCTALLGGTVKGVFPYFAKRVFCCNNLFFTMA